MRSCVPNFFGVFVFFLVAWFRLETPNRNLAFMFANGGRLGSCNLFVGAHLILILIVEIFVSNNRHNKCHCLELLFYLRGDKFSIFRCCCCSLIFSRWRSPHRLSESVFVALTFCGFCLENSHKMFPRECLGGHFVSERIGHRAQITVKATARVHDLSAALHTPTDGACKTEIV